MDSEEGGEVVPIVGAVGEVENSCWCGAVKGKLCHDEAAEGNVKFAGLVRGGLAAEGIEAALGAEEGSYKGR